MPDLGRTGPVELLQGHPSAVTPLWVIADGWLLVSGDRDGNENLATGPVTGEQRALRTMAREWCSTASTACCRTSRQPARSARWGGRGAVRGRPARAGYGALARTSLPPMVS
ncbi:MAG: hypothetical protein M5U09_18610 [Gammaproteobacteria bacterium]|nr:hypothetical protein [Gammaproteobacteria bacterium]